MNNKIRKTIAKSKYLNTFKRCVGHSLAPVVGTPGSHCPGAWVQSLVGELRSRKLCSVAKHFKNK